MTKQPVWKYITNLGDSSPLTEGGYFIFEDTMGVYPPEGEKYFPEQHLYYRFPLEKTDDEWFMDKLKEVAETCGIREKELRDSFVSHRTLVRARAYEMIGDYFGYINLDQSPQPITEDEAFERYSTLRINGGQK